MKSIKKSKVMGVTFTSAALKTGKTVTVNLDLGELQGVGV